MSTTEPITLYECDNPACSLNRAGDSGHFTGGITAAQVNLLTGTPVEHLSEGIEYGEGFCPNCGKPGTAVGEHEFLPEGNDPYAKLHAYAVDKAETPEEAQAIFLNEVKNQVAADG